VIRAMWKITLFLIFAVFSFTAHAQLGPPGLGPNTPNQSSNLVVSTLQTNGATAGLPVTLYGVPGAKFDGVTDDSAAWTAALSSVCGNGGVLHVPSGTSLSSTALTCAAGAKNVTIQGEGCGTTQLKFTAATNGLAATLTTNPATSVWGSITVRDISIVRGPTSPAIANTGLSIVADPAPGVPYLGNGMIDHVCVVGQTNIYESVLSGWANSVVITGVGGFTIQNLTTFAPNTTGFTSYGTQADTNTGSVLPFTNTTGITAGNYVYGINIAPGATVASVAANASVTLSAPIMGKVPGGSFIGFTTSNDTGLTISGRNATSPYGFAPSINIINPNINGNTVGMSVNGLVQGVHVDHGSFIGNGIGVAWIATAAQNAEEIDIIGTTLGTSYRGILLSYVDQSHVGTGTNNRGDTLSPNWIGVEIDEGGLNTVGPGTKFLGIGPLGTHGAEYGVLLNSVSGIGTNAQNVITGIDGNTLAGYVVVLAGTTANTIATSISGNGVSGTVSTPSGINTNIVLGVLNSGAPDIGYTGVGLNYTGRIGVGGLPAIDKQIYALGNGNSHGVYGAAGAALYSGLLGYSFDSSVSGQIGAANAYGVEGIAAGAGRIAVYGTASGGALSASFTGGAVLLPVYTVSTLPTCGAGLNGAAAYVTDATTPAYNATLTGGGAVRVLAICNGTNWTAH